MVFQTKKRRLPSGDTWPRPGERTSSMVWMRRLTPGSRGVGAYLRTVSAGMLSAPCPEYGVCPELPTGAASRTATATTRTKVMGNSARKAEAYSRSRRSVGRPVRRAIVTGSRDSLSGVSSVPPSFSR